MADIAARLDRALVAAGIPIVGVTIGRITDPATWIVQYAPAATTLQRSQGEALRAAFDPDAAPVAAAELDDIVRAVLDAERLISAVVWTVIDTFAAPATIAKYQTARTKIIAVYKSRPWIP